MSKCIGLALLAAALLSPAIAGAQEATTGRQIYEQQLRMRLDEQARRGVGEGQPVSNRLDADGGGWFTFSLYHYDDEAAQRVRTLRQYQLRGWASVSLDGVHNGYVRGMTGWDNWVGSDNPRGTGDDHTGPWVERAWYEWDLQRALYNETGQVPDNWFKIKVGRQYVSFGTGLAMSMPLDAVVFTGRVGDWQVRALGGQTLRNTSNIDQSSAVFYDMERCFWGVEVSYEGLSRHRPFAYVLTQNDHTDEDPEFAFQEYDYDSTYIGLGSVGTIFLPDLTYQVELVGQTGRSHARTDFLSDGARETICAMALDAQVGYVWRDTPMTPQVRFEYLWASGDDDRLFSATATDGGNAPGTRDVAFNGFGFRDTGLAFSPRISNLHMWAVEASCYPLQDCHRLLENLEVGAKFFAYMKDRRHGPTSDSTTAGTVDPFLGVEADFFVNWRVTSDVSLTVRYGAFSPAGGVSEPNDWRHFVLAGVTYSF